MLAMQNAFESAISCQQTDRKTACGSAGQSHRLRVGLQGGWELDESCPEAAARETVEEAGVRGTLEVQSHLVTRTLLTTTPGP